MFAVLTALLRAERRPPTEDDTLRHEWNRLLATATSPHERDEINDLFGKAIAI